MKRTALMLLMVLLLAGAAHACPMCKDTIANTSGVGLDGGASTAGMGTGSSMPGLSSGFNMSIFTMFAGLFGSFGLVCHTIYKGVKSSKR